MQTYTLDISDRTVRLASEDATLVRTSAGADRVELRFLDDEWLAFDLACAFSIGGQLVDVPVAPVETADGWTATCEVPDALLAYEGALGVCVHGTDEDGNRIITAAAKPLAIEHEGDAPAEEA